MAEKAQAGVIGTLAAIATDWVAFGGDIVLSTLSFVLHDTGLLVSFFAYLSSLAANVPGLPETMIEQAYQIVLLLVVLITAIRIARGIYSRVIAS